MSGAQTIWSTKRMTVIILFVNDATASRPPGNCYGSNDAPRCATGFGYPLRTVALRQVAPRRAGPQNEEDAVENLATSGRGRPFFLPSAPGNSGAMIDHSASVRSKRAIEASFWKP